MLFGYLPLVIIFAVGLAIAFWVSRKKYFSWIKKIWFFDRSIYSLLHILFLLAAMTFFLISALDLRGHPESLNTSIPDQKTVILIDASSSMLAEDIRPNRFKRSLVMARHFIRKAAGHQISIVLFSDTHKRLVPFTDDIDLLDSRVAALENLTLFRGSSRLSVAITESLQYFKSDSGKEVSATGNLLIFSDSEELGGRVKLNVPEGVNVAFVGVGTLRGARIPLRDRNGVIHGYKKFKRQEVVTRLNEDFLKSLKSEIKNYKYWVARSYSLNTEEILSFFKEKFILRQKSNSRIVVRPIYSHYIASLAIILYIMAVIFSQMVSFKKTVVSILLMSFLLPLEQTSAQQVAMGHGEERKKEVSPALAMEIAKMKGGAFSRGRRLKLAENLLAEGHSKMALSLYRENVVAADKVEPEVGINYGVALIKSGNVTGGLKVYDQMRSRLAALSESLQGHPQHQDYKDIIRNNVIMALHKKKQKGSSGDKNKKQQKGKDQQQQQSKEQSQSGQKQQQGGSSSQDQKKENKNEQSEQNEKQDSDQNKQKQQEQKERNIEQDISQKEQELKKKRKMIKVAPVIKQIMNQDREQQKRYWRTETADKFRKIDKKDW